MNLHELLAQQNLGIPKALKISARLSLVESVLLGKLCRELNCTTSDVVSAGIRVLHAHHVADPNVASEHELAPTV